MEHYWASLNCAFIDGMSVACNQPWSVVFIPGKLANTTNHDAFSLSPESWFLTFFSPPLLTAPCRTDLRQEFPFKSDGLWVQRRRWGLVLRKTSGPGRGNQGVLGWTSSHNFLPGPHISLGAILIALLFLCPHFPSGLQPIPYLHNSV